ncbi:MAG: GNAT family N-acyltransferase, partial [Pseudomonadota bacterium]
MAGSKGLRRSFEGESVMSSTQLNRQGIDICPPEADLVSAVSQEIGKYRLRLAMNAADAESLYRLRFEVFNLELEEGLEASYQTGLDQDAHDQFCHHLLVEHLESGDVVGTYRLQDGRMANQGPGFYSQAEFDLTLLGEELLGQSVELGRACIAREHRNTRVLFLLWRGLAAYMNATGNRYFFGCCSLTSTDPAEGHALYDVLVSKGHIDREKRVTVQSEYACPPAGAGRPDVRIPKLMRLYLGYGATIVSGPAMDHEFRTIDYLALFDMEALSDEHKR